MTEAKEKPAPLVFISHDSRDAKLAASFSKLLRDVSSGMLKSFNSSDKRGTQGIPYGEEWYQTIIEKVCSASDVVCLLTERSLGRPWILYEAGIAKGNSNAPIIGIALGIPLTKANEGPFSQFQNCDDDVESLTGLVMQLTKRIPETEPDQNFVKTQVEAFKKTANDVIKKLAGAGGAEKEDESLDQKLPKVSLAILHVFRNRNRAELWDETDIIPVLASDYHSRIEIEYGIDELLKVYMIKRSRYERARTLEDDDLGRRLLSLTEQGKKYIVQNM